MAAVETGQSRSAGRAAKKHKKKRRLSIRIDMTPMVDVAFLLLTFFMLTTVFNKPQTMEINLPPEETTVEVAESNLLTIRVGEDGSIYANVGNDEPTMIVTGVDFTSKDVAKKLEALKKLRSLLIDRLQANPKLITLIKVDRNGTYNMLVDVMDELNLANITRFSIAPMQEADKKLLAKATAA